MPTARTGRYLVPQKWGTFKACCDALQSDRRTKKCMLPFFTFPSCFKPVFTLAAPILGIDKSVPKRTWGATPTLDYSKTTADFDLDAQGFKRIESDQMMIEMDLAFQKYPITMFKSSLGRYK